jgi:hypothetical protein
VNGAVYLEGSPRHPESPPEGRYTERGKTAPPQFRLKQDICTSRVSPVSRFPSSAVGNRWTTGVR